MNFALSVLEFVALAVAFVVAGWARRKYKAIWAKVLFFFAAVIAGNVVYFILGVICAIILSADAATRTVNAHAVGSNGWEVLSATIVAAVVGFVRSLSDPMWPIRKSTGP